MMVLTEAAFNLITQFSAWCWGICQSGSRTLRRPGCLSFKLIFAFSEIHTFCEMVRFLGLSPRLRKSRLQWVLADYCICCKYGIHKGTVLHDVCSGV